MKTELTAGYWEYRKNDAMEYFNIAVREIFNQGLDSPIENLHDARKRLRTLKSLIDDVETTYRDYEMSAVLCQMLQEREQHENNI